MPYVSTHAHAHVHGAAHTIFAAPGEFRMCMCTDTCKDMRTDMHGHAYRRVYMFTNMGTSMAHGGPPSLPCPAEPSVPPAALTRQWHAPSLPCEACVRACVRACMRACVHAFRGATGGTWWLIESIARCTILARRYLHHLQ